ncbi:hypothetical protein ACFSTH_14550 [Paenibacillus yanchengensis]|uniref:Uncharacterized protein n=1 Tax=Paenibacillus yanchengensis TaxID=2035833 RepID=A0ABW4YEV3_9BACL
MTNMYKRPTRAQALHEDTVYELAKQFELRGFRVLADHPEWVGIPFNVENYRPDIIALRQYSNSNRVVESYLIEIETNDSYRTRHAIDQISALNKKGSEGITVYWVIVCRLISFLTIEKDKALSLLRRYELHYVQLAHFDPISKKFEVHSRIFHEGGEE